MRKCNEKKKATMSVETWLVFGGRGWIGTQLTAWISDKNLIFAQSRAEDRDAVRAEIQTHAPDVVLCLVGRTRGPDHPNIDYLETRPNINLRDNLTAPFVLAQETQNRYMIYMGTGCIYDGSDDPGFGEDDPPNFTGSAYSRMKACTDQLMRGFPHVLNLRIRMPITDRHSPFNFVTKLTKFKHVINRPNSLSVLSSLLPLIPRMAARRITGTLNFTNPGVMTHNEVLAMYRDEVDPDFKWANFSVAEQDRKLLARRSNTQLDCTRLVTLFPQTPDIRTALRAAFKRYRKFVPEKIMVTGGAGFIGSHLVDHLAPRFEVHVVDCMTYSANIRNIREDTVVHNVDITDLPGMRRVFQKVRPDTIFHLAAETHVDSSFTQSIQFTKTNVVGTHVMLQLAHEFKVERFIHMSTDEVYGGNCDTQLGERTVLNPTNPYSASKVGAESLVKSYHASFGLNSIIVRGNNVYGPRQHPEKVIPNFITRAQTGQPLLIHGDGSARRSFIHVDDLVRALETIMTRGTLGEVYNIGTINEFSVLELAQRVCELFPQTRIKHVADRCFNDPRYNVRYQKLLELGWRETVPFDRGLQAVVEWTRTHSNFWFEWWAKQQRE